MIKTLFKGYVLFSILLIFVGCSKINNDYKAVQKLNALKNYVSKDTLNIVFDWAFPSNANRVFQTGLLPNGSSPGAIDIQGIDQQFVKQGKELTVELPYYGQIQMGLGYGAKNIGIHYKGTTKNTSVTYNPKNKSYIYTMDIVTKKNESLRLTLTLFVSQKARLQLVSSHRSITNYTGEWSYLK